MGRFVSLLCVALVAMASIAQGQEAAGKRELWLYYVTNFQVDGNIPKLEKVWRRAAAAGYTHVLVVDSKLAKLGDLGDMTKIYMRNVEKAKNIAAELKLQLVPAVFHIGYSNNMLWHDPNLAEGLPVKDQPFVVKGGKAVVAEDSPVSLSGKMNYHDDAVKVNGSTATLKDFEGNARFNYKLKTPPFRCYVVSVKIKTNNFRGHPEIKALAGKDSLQSENLGVKPTQDWTEHHVVFNSLNHDEVTLYFGVWGGGKGELQWKDWRIEESPLINVLRREGAPFVVKDAASGKVLTEGKDFERFKDPKLGTAMWKGDYNSYHQPPVLKMNNVPDGRRLLISWYHSAIVYDGQVSVCPSEPKTMELLADEAKRVRAAFGSKGYMMSHDEIRTWNWDEACQKRHMDAGEILADNVRKSAKLLSGSDVYVWSDMFDPFHNAHGDYYLVRGDFKGSWEGLDPSITIMNWNFGKRNESLRFFADRGHKQIIAGYYDHNPKEIQQWLAASKGVKGVIGVMYTTWEGNFNDLEAFAKFAKEGE